jgi:hypothetical protein
MESQCSAPPVSIEDRTVVGHRVVETLQYWPYTLISLIPRLFHYKKGQLRTGSGEMTRVACTHPMKLLGRRREVEYCILGWREPIHVLEDPSEG